MGFGKDGKGQILKESTSITLGTLADQTAIKASTQLALQEDFRIIKVEYWAVVEGHIANEDMILFGIADNELSVAEIAECVNVDGPLDRNDRENQEFVMRPVFTLACCPNAASGNVPSSCLPAEKTLRWTFSAAEGWTWFAINKSGAQLTTGTIIRIHAKYYGVWLT